MKKILALAAALAVAAGLTLTGAAPAQAAGWAPGVCSQHTSDWAGNVCVAVHTVPFQNGIRVDQVAICVAKVSQTYYNGFRGVKNNTIEYRGSSGNYIGLTPLPDAEGATPSGICVYGNSAMQMGNGACYTLTGTVDLAQFPDSQYTLKGRVLGGAYNC